MIRLFISVILLSLLWSFEILADRGLKITSSVKFTRTALVIGNSKYTHISPLINPANDAKDITKALIKTGFKVDLVLDADYDQMDQAITRFGDQIQKGGAGLFYFAGHGIRVNGKNYLIPIGSNISRKRHVRTKAISVEDILIEMEQANNDFNMLILDACRDNPLPRSFSRNVKSGLAQINPPKGTLVAFATAAGDIAMDGDGRNSPFAKHLLKNINTPNLHVETMFRKVSAGVQKETQGKQVPWRQSSFTGDFYFVTGDGSIIEKNPIISKSVQTVLLGKVIIKTNPEGAKIYLNEAYVGTGQKKLTLKSGSYTLSASKLGYKECSEKIFVSIGDELDVTLNLNTIKVDNIPIEVTLRINRTPVNAKVRILNIKPKYYDGIRLKPGNYHIEVSKHGYKKFKQWVTLGKANKSLNVKLDPFFVFSVYNPANWEILRGNWRFGENSITSTVYSEVSLLLLKKELKNYVMEMTMTRISGKNIYITTGIRQSLIKGGHAMVFRNNTSSRQGYQFGILFDGRYNLFNGINGQFYTIGNLKGIFNKNWDSTDIINNNKNKLRVEVIGDNVKIFINSKHFVEFSDNTHQYGAPMLIVSKNSQIIFSDISIIQK